MATQYTGLLIFLGDFVMRKISFSMFLLMVATWFGVAGAQEITAIECDEITLKNYEQCEMPDDLKRTFRQADNGDAIAAYTLGRLYQEGGRSPTTNLIKKDIEKAALYYEISARRGYMSAQSQLAWLLHKYFLPIRKEERDYWDCKAALQNSSTSIISLTNELAVTKTHDTWEAFCADVLPKDEQPPSWQEEMKDSKKDDCLNKKHGT